jgi:hypothetical protein
MKLGLCGYFLMASLEAEIPSHVMHRKNSNDSGVNE